MEEDVSFSSESGARLRGKLFTPREGTKRVIIFSPGFTGYAAQNRGFATFANDRGYAVFNFDFFAHGNSKGKSVDLTLSEEMLDLKAAIDVMSTRFEKIFLVGHSLGGLISCSMANKSSAVVLWAPGIRVKDVFIEMFKAKEMRRISDDIPSVIKRRGFVELPHEWMVSDPSGSPFVIGLKLWNEISNFDWIGTMENVRVPLKLIQAGKDGDVPIEFNRDAFSYVKSKKEFETVKGADHVFKGKRVQLYRSTMDWFDKF